MTENQIKLSIIIVSWNVRELLKNCLQSIQAHLHTIPLEIIVVDNNSGDGSADMVKKNFPQVQLIKNKDNKGFGRANNQGLLLARGTYTLFLNDDTQFFDSSFLQAMEFLKTHPSIGILGVQLKNIDGSLQPSVRHFPKLSDQLMYLLKLHILFPRSQPIKRYLWQDFDYSRTAAVEQVMGAAMLLTTNLAKTLHGFDPRYPNWFEEVDLCKRVQAQGLDVQYFSGSSITHVKGASFTQHRPFFLQRVYNRSMRIYFKTWEPWWSYALIVLVQPIGLALAGLVQISESLGLGVRKFKPKQV